MEYLSVEDWASHMQVGRKKSPRKSVKIDTNNTEFSNCTRIMRLLYKITVALMSTMEQQQCQQTHSGQQKYKKYTNNILFKNSTRMMRDWNICQLEIERHVWKSGEERPTENGQKLKPVIMSNSTGIMRCLSDNQNICHLETSSQK